MAGAWAFRRTLGGCWLAIVRCADFDAIRSRTQTFLLRNLGLAIRNASAGGETFSPPTEANRISPSSNAAPFSVIFPLTACRSECGPQPETNGSQTTQPPTATRQSDGNQKIFDEAQNSSNEFPKCYLRHDSGFQPTAHILNDIKYICQHSLLKIRWGFTLKVVRIVPPSFPAVFMPPTLIRGSNSFRQRLHTDIDQDRQLQLIYVRSGSVLCQANLTGESF